MTDKRFNIVFKGEIIAGADEAAVKANVGKLFKANDKVLARLFSGEAIVIKKAVDQAGAMKYRALMKKAGAVCYAQDVTAGESAQEAKPAANAPPPSAASANQEVDKGEAQADWSLAAPGSILVEAREVAAVEIPDIGGITLAPVGADVLENPPEMHFEDLPDVSGIDLAPVGADVADPVEEEIAPIPDVSGIDLAPVGADVADPVEKETVPIPDVSTIDLAPVGADVADPKPKPPEPDVDISHIKLDSQP